MSETEFREKFAGALANPLIRSALSMSEPAAPSGSLAVTTCSKDRATDVRPLKRRYPAKRASSQRRKDLLNLRVMSYVTADMSADQIARRLKLSRAHAYRLIERTGCRTCILTPREYKRLQKTRNPLENSKAKPRRSNVKDEPRERPARRLHRSLRDGRARWL
jgi:hypothetical protein